MKVYDKAAWHIDGGEPSTEVVSRFREIFIFLKEKNMLTCDGLETLEYAMDASVSINSDMVNKDGNDFLLTFYDKMLMCSTVVIRQNLLEAYQKYVDHIV